MEHPAPDGQRVPVGPDSGVLDIMRTTRSMRRLRPDPVPQELLLGVLTEAMSAPSPENRQDLEFVLVTDRTQIGRIAPLWRRAVDLYEVVRGPADAGPLGPRSASAVRDLARSLEFAPALVAICQPTTAVRDNVPDLDRLRRVMRSVGARRSLRLARAAPRILLLRDAGAVYPALQNLLLAARAYGLAASVFTLHLLLEKDFERVLAVPDGVRIMAFVALGWPAGRFGPVRRRPLAEVLHTDRW